MSNLAFPQLLSGAMVQYPLRKRRVIQSAVNTYADGSVSVSNVNPNTQTIWELSYKELGAADQAALQDHFAACQGPLMPFVFIDPTDNMLSNSDNLALGAWMMDPLLSVSSETADPVGGTTAFTLVNASGIDQRISQQINASANFQYCFSVYASAPNQTSVKLSLSAQSSQSQSFLVNSAWTRLVSAMQLADTLIGFEASIVIPPAQTVVIWGPQLEPQISPSRYRATSASGGVYPNAHLLGNSITFESEGPESFSTSINIETK